MCNHNFFLSYRLMALGKYSVQEKLIQVEFYCCKLNGHILHGRTVPKKLLQFSV